MGRKRRRREADDANDDHTPSKKHGLGRRRVFFSDGVTLMLNTWMASHVANPYPSRAEMEEMAEAAGLTFIQVRQWFINRRRRLPPTVVQRALAIQETITRLERKRSGDAHASSSTRRRQDRLALSPSTSSHPTEVVPPPGHGMGQSVIPNGLQSLADLPSVPPIEVRTRKGASSGLQAAHDGWRDQCQGPRGSGFVPRTEFSPLASAALFPLPCLPRPWTYTAWPSSVRLRHLPHRP
ncbi:uncharacterized protein AMSG_04079 [Thecamonas trahens ATCC 50062]|uniref:Homeobox domain-containing protein n=1 Tax=Thecamonas trahens ATCC 50062 TaxID=461836 RepID=A0A0L0D669_THETB|nr:hypothetical protein AMSG_04079 [Thecamonas trahens ATCC 50062]KNC47849.1 hypothetical protein AMSG_04079 [Thecamonas trahens ATCC 50062]|eukprot:XP_013759327.1 hypothetical protein AMSG_04079 [Thecamonas trahens ATCC 50062]